MRLYRYDRVGPHPLAHIASMGFFKRYPDSVIIVFFSFLALNTIVKSLSGNAILGWQHYFGFALLPVVSFLYFSRNRRFIEILLVLGLFNIINLNVYFLKFGFGFSLLGGSLEIGLQPWFFLATMVYIYINWAWIGKRLKKAPTEEELHQKQRKEIDFWKGKLKDQSSDQLRTMVDSPAGYEQAAVEAAREILAEAT